MYVPRKSSYQPTILTAKTLVCPTISHKNEELCAECQYSGSNPGLVVKFSAWFNNKIHTIRGLDENDKIEQLQNKIYEHTGVIPEVQRLFYKQNEVLS